MQKRVAIGAFITIWAIALQGHMMWMKRQDAFKHKFGGEQSAPDSAVINTSSSEKDEAQSLSSDQ